MKSVPACRASQPMTGHWPTSAFDRNRIGARLPRIGISDQLMWLLTNRTVSSEGEPCWCICSPRQRQAHRKQNLAQGVRSMALRVTTSVIRKPAASIVVAARKAIKAVIRTQSLSQLISRLPISGRRTHEVSAVAAGQFADLQHDQQIGAAKIRIPAGFAADPGAQAHVGTDQGGD